MPTVLHGRFASDCSWHAKNYCKGTCVISIADSLDKILNQGGDASIQITYDNDSVFKPPLMVPNPLPAMPVQIKKSIDGQYTLTINPSWLRPWEFVFNLIGMKVIFRIEDNKLKGTYTVSGGIGVPKDAGWIFVQLPE